jgi:endonuclease/exonuclease/phosphatase family metal-dependent hydrolase
MASSLRVVQLNAGSLLEPGWDDRRHEIVAWIDQLGPDIVCFQEIWESSTQENTAGWIADRASGEWHTVFGGASIGAAIWPDPDLRFGPAIMSRWPIDSAERHALPLAADPDAFIASIPWALLHARTAGLDIFATHLVSPPHHAVHRVAQVLAIDDIVQATCGTPSESFDPARRAAMPPILCGDFNAEPDSDEIRYLSSLAVIDGRSTFYQDAWRVAGDGGPGFTQDWRTNPIAASLNVHRKRIDYVFVGDPYSRHGHAGRVLSAVVVCDEALTGTLASDHAGLAVDIVWPGRPRPADRPADQSADHLAEERP